MISRGSRFVIA